MESVLLQAHSVCRGAFFKPETPTTRALYSTRYFTVHAAEIGHPAGRHPPPPLCFLALHIIYAQKFARLCLDTDRYHSSGHGTDRPHATRMKATFRYLRARHFSRRPAFFLIALTPPLSEALPPYATPFSFWEIRSPRHVVMPIRPQSSFRVASTKVQSVVARRQITNPRPHLPHTSYSVSTAHQHGNTRLPSFRLHPPALSQRSLCPHVGSC